MNKEKLIECWDELNDETKEQILKLGDKGIRKIYFVPELGEYYYYHSYDYNYSNDGIGATTRAWQNSNIDKFHEETGNCFETADEAMFAGNCNYFAKRYETYVTRHSEKLDWKNKNQIRYFAFYNFGIRKICFSKDFAIRTQGVIYASSEIILQDAIDDIGEENFLKYVLRVLELENTKPNAADTEDTK